MMKKKKVSIAVLCEWTNERITIFRFLHGNPYGEYVSIHPYDVLTIGINIYRIGTVLTGATKGIAAGTAATAAKQCIRQPGELKEWGVLKNLKNPWIPLQY
jgi:hypothetical protein